MDLTAPIDAADLPDGTQVSYQGMTFTAYPAYCSAFRWHAGPMMLTDEAMTEALDWGHAQVTGRDAAAIELYEQILSDCRDS